MGNEHTESRLKKLTKDELIILCQMLGIKTGFSFFQKEADLIDAIFRKDKNEVEKCLSLLSILKASDTDWLRRTFEFELGIKKETSAEKVAEILSKENVKTIKKFAGKIQYEKIIRKIFPKGLSEIIIAGCSITFIVSFYADFSYVAAIISIFALGFVLFTAAYTSPLAIKKRVTVEHWQIISVIIAFSAVSLLLYTLFSEYPEFERKDFISNWAGNVATLMGFLFGAILYFCNERPKLENWWRKHSGKVMVSIIFMVILGYLYVDNCIIAGRVVFEDGKTGVGGATIRIKGVSGIQDWLCREEFELCDTIKQLFQSCDNCKSICKKLEDELKEKYKDNIPIHIKEESDPARKNNLMLRELYPEKIPIKRFYENFIKNNKLCATDSKNTQKEEDEDRGKFSFRFFSLESKKVTFEIIYEGKNYTEVRDIKLGVKTIEFKILRIEGNWKCYENTNEKKEKLMMLTIKRDGDKISISQAPGDVKVVNEFSFEGKSFDYKAEKCQFSSEEYDQLSIIGTIDNTNKRIDINLTDTLNNTTTPIYCERQ